MTPLQATLVLARRGNQQILSQLRRTLDDHPEIWKANGDLAKLLEQTWIERIGGPNPDYSAAPARDGPPCGLISSTRNS